MLQHLGGCEMARSHSVDILSSGFVMKTATSEMFNDKIKAEIDQIRALHLIYPNLMVPVLHDGVAAGRCFYVLERKPALPLSRVVFDGARPLVQRAGIIRAALEAITTAIELELHASEHLTCEMHSRLLQEWEAIPYMHELFDKVILLDGVPCELTGRQVVETAIGIAKNSIFRSVERAHFNFHFGNILYDDISHTVSFIDPDFSVRGIDPNFGFARFAFSFWHELAAEINDTIKIVPVPGGVMFVVRQTEHRQILNGIPELKDIYGLLPWINEEDRDRFFVLATYCFLRSIRINGTKHDWCMPQSPAIADVGEILTLGLVAYLGVAKKSDLQITASPFIKE